ncbi:RNA helicase aquarius [Saccoglossus kowalevskii]|uniref:Intron-binding protein aquarius n=1 Tax=Saccoglossus kowalevskii TaxID=10224 RepID=A0ABM0MV10_SACKO|nr:PREDICTED: intron-binding protein aquarius [Saccoglossus kowalevskii]
MSGSKKHGAAPTVEQINADVLTQLASLYWAPHSTLPRKSYDPKVIEDIYKKELLGSKFAIRRVMLLEFSQYLENYLWPNFNPEQTSQAHCLSIAVMINEKFREKVPAWQVFKKNPDHFPAFFRKVLDLSVADESTISIREQSVLMSFIIHCFNSLGRLEQELKTHPKYKKFWGIIKKNDSKADDKALARLNFERRFVAKIIDHFFTILNSIPEKGEVSMQKVHYCERFLELLIDMESLLPARRFFNTVLDNAHLVVKCRMSNLSQRKEGRLFNQLLNVLKFYAGFEIDERSGEALTDHDMTNIHYDRITSLQRGAFKYFPELKKFSMANVGSIDTRDKLLAHFEPLSTEKLHEIAAYLNLVPPFESDEKFEKEFLLELLVSRHERRASQLQELNEMPLYPTEEVLWDENIVPTQFFSGEDCLALPKLNLQFLTLHDYLLRNFNLFRLESTYEIRQDVEDSVSRLKPWLAEDGNMVFGGWARMALPITTFSVVEVAKPNIGENHPSQVRADITVVLNLRSEIRTEWEGLRKHDVAFVITVRPTRQYGTKYKEKEPFIQQVGLTYIRGCEIEGLLDDSGNVIEEGIEPRPELKGQTRTYRVWLDPNQYQQDMAKTATGDEDVYETFNIIMRRKPKENNFKAVLETIRDLMNTECVVPDWLHDIILGYGDPGAAHYSKMDSAVSTLDFVDTFLNVHHLKSSFPEYEIKVTTEDPASQKPPFKVTFPAKKSGKKRKKGDTDDKVAEEKQKLQLVVEPYSIPNRGPYPFNQPKKNAIHFTPTQIEAIKAGMQPGLTMVVGPPGTGKTDVAVQIISNIYHNFPDQRTLIVTHSNQALNQLFEKIIALDIDERHLLRLGHGEEALETEKDFSRYGRVNFVLARRLELLKEVARLQESLGVPGDVSYTCETAGHFFLYQVLSRWEKYTSKIKSSRDVKNIQEDFPFEQFFSNAPQPIFHGKSYEEDMDIAEGCFRHLRKIFTELEEFRAFELLRSGADRSKYLLIKEAKIIAMTCTHAALKRRDLVDVGFKYDNILMEESAQILEIETFIPLLLQIEVEKMLKEMKRAQQREVEDTKALEDMIHQVETNLELTTNLAEAEYVVALFMFMRLIGYPADKISILTTYNGQKHLIRDVINQRCGNNPLIGRPSKVTTVDRFQGQQNDYILLSLVRTKAVGHLR